ncbi:S49 family peptidase [Sphingomonas sp. RB3P16]|uniref:S49 family peptidase n=1 Tax=Parasphingomonas frigoris TaxID=3096163 RepID=UPI002FCB2B23
MTLNPLIALFADQPALVEPSMAARFESNLNSVMAHPRASEMLSGELFASADDFWAEDSGWCRPYVVTDGILQIPIKGVLLNNFAYQLYDWATGYDYIWQAFKRGCADFAIGEIKGIALIIDSCGGYVAGCWDAIDKAVALKDQTGVPVRSFAHESAYSAAYGWATVGDHIAVSRTGGVGSIGTVTTHFDYSGAMEKSGVKVTFIASDPSKVEGSSMQPLSQDAKDRIQTRIDEMNNIFVATVARSRGLSESVIRNDLKAHCYTALQATSNGLADSIGTLEDATSAYADFLDDQSEPQGEDEMAAPAASTVDQAVHDTAVSTARAEGVAEGAASATARINAILASDEGKARPKAALSAALKTGMSADEAKAFLADLPAESAAAPAAPAAAAGGTAFENAMADGNPDLGAEAAAAADKDDPEGIKALHNLGAGLGLKGFTRPTSK